MKVFRVLFSVFCLIIIGSTNVFAQNPSESLKTKPDIQSPSSISSDPISTVGHGGVFDQNFKPIVVTPTFIRRTINLYIDGLTRIASNKESQEFDVRLSELKKLRSIDEATERFLRLDYLIREVNPPEAIQLEVRSNVLRAIWYKEFLGIKRYGELINPKTHYPIDISKAAGDVGILFNKATSSSGPEYREECRDAGVPIPPTWGTSQWEYKGDLSTKFLNLGNPIEVWSFQSDQPKGICVALPRVSGTNISALGIICLGTETNNACFYDAENVPVNAEKPIEEFLAGDDLFNGICTDCHAGENPYVVHPDGPLNLAPSNRGTDWYQPLIKPSWPQNPGPFTLLDLVTLDNGDSSCLNCHKPGSAGRFPDILALNTHAGGMSGYCRLVLSQAIGDTMPGPNSNYEKHAKALLSFCEQQLPPSGEVPTPDVKDDPDIVSPPVIVPKLYACSSAIEVSGGIYGAELIVNVNDIEVATVVVSKPSQTVVETGPLEEGDVVQAVQIADGVMSDPSVARTVVDYKEDYPSGLPRPEIDPTRIYECGRMIAVRHVRGATVTVFTNDTDEVSYRTAAEWTNVQPRIVPFILGDRYSAQQSLCGDVSAMSREEQSQSAPSPMPIPSVNPSPPIIGQPLLNIENLAEGAQTVVAESAVGELSSATTAVTWIPELNVGSGLGRPIDSSDNFIVVSTLCEETKTELRGARSCDDLEAPRIATPVVGQTHVTATRHVPGARILIFDEDGIKIADGTGVLVGLTRAIEPGDVLTVIQRLENCISSTAFQTGVICVEQEKCG